MKPKTKINHSSVARVVIALLEDTSARKATIFQDGQTVIKATRQRRPGKRSRTETYLVTSGAPNFLERKRVKRHIRIGVPLPTGVVVETYPTKTKCRARRTAAR